MKKERITMNTDRKTLKLILIVLSVILLANTVFPVLAEKELPEYTLNDLYKAAIEQSNILAAGKEDVLIARVEKHKSIADFIPDMYTLGSFRMYTESKKAMGTFTVQPNNLMNWGAGLGQSFSLGGREVFDLRMKSKNFQKSKIDFDTLNENYLLDVANTYYDILKAKRLLNIAKDNLKRLEKHLDTAKIRYQVGEVTTTVVLRAEAEVSQAKAELAKASNNLVIQRAKLVKLTGIESNAKIVESPYEVDNTQELPDLKEFALKHRSELKSMELQNRIAKDMVRLTRSSFFPDLRLEGVYVGNKANPSTSFAIKHSMYGQVTLNFDIFHGGKRIAELREAKAKLRQSELMEKDLIESVILQVETAYYNSLTQRSVLAQIQDQYKLAQENYKHIEAQFKEGFASNLDVVDANNFLYSTEQKLADAKNDYEISHMIVKKVTGKLLTEIKEDLNPAKGETKNEKL